MRKPQKENILALLIVALIIAWFVWMNTPNEPGESGYELPPIIGGERGLNYETGRWIYYETGGKPPTQKQRYHDSIRMYHARSKSITDRQIEEYLEREYPDLEDYWGEN